MSRRPDPYWLKHVDRAYGVLLYLYPRRFRQTWGESMHQALRDCCRDLTYAQRNPTLWICTQLLPDLATSAGREQWITFEEETTMKRMSLLMFLLLGSVALLGWSRNSSVGSELLFSTSQWMQNREQRALESGYADYRVELIRTAMASDRPDERAVVHPLARLRASKSEAAVLPPDLQAQLDATALVDVGNRSDQFFVAATCRVPAALARLQANEPDNGAVWAITMTCRSNAGDAVGAHAAMLRMAQSTRYDSRSGALLLALTEVLERKPLPPALGRQFASQTQLLSTLLWVAHEPEREGIHSMCLWRLRDTAESVLQAECRAAYTVFANQADSEWVRRSGRSVIANTDGQPLKSLDPTPFHQQLDAKLAVWRQLPAARRANLAAAGADERMLLAQAKDSTNRL